MTVFRGWPFGTVVALLLLGVVAPIPGLTPSVGAQAADAYREAVLVDSPVAYWRFGATDPGADETGSHPLDLDFARVDVFPSLVTTTSDGAIAVAGSFDGTPVVVAEGVAANTTNYALEYWVARNEFFNNDDVGLRFDAGTIGGTLNDTIEVRVGNPSTTFTISAPTGTAVHVVVEQAGSTGNVYVDGQLFATFDPGNTSVSDIGFPFGDKFPEGPGGHSIDETSFYDHPLGPDRVAAHYEAGIGVDRCTDLNSSGDINTEILVDGPLAFWDFNTSG